jgi:hypothetical protein
MGKIRIYVPIKKMKRKTEKTSPRGRKEKITPEQLIKALADNKGIQAEAARVLGIGRSTVTDYLERYPEVRAAYIQINEATIDGVESELLRQISSGNITGIIFYLKTKAKHRGYIEHSIHDIQSGGKPITWKDFITAALVPDENKEKDTDSQ